MQVSKQNYLNIAIHFISWLLFGLLTNYIVSISNSKLSVSIVFYSTYAFLIALFYTNYLVLVPRFITKKHIVLYIGIIILLFVLYYYLPRLLHEHPPRPRHHFPKNEKPLFTFFRMRYFLFLVVYIFSTSIGVMKLLFSLKEKQQKAEFDKSKAELNLLQSQVSPHFLFNTLNSIYYLAEKKDDSTGEAVLQLSDIMRYTLTESKTEFVPLNKEMLFLEKYIELQKLRLSEKTKVDYTLPSGNESFEIAPLLLIPFIENCFKFGVSNHEASTISLKINITQQRELKMVLNNRVFSKKENESTKFGITNAKQRLEALYPENHKLQIMEMSDNFTVLLLLKL